MAEKRHIRQSLWARERRLAHGPEYAIQQPLEAIHDGGLDGCGVRFVDPAFAREATGFLRANSLIRSRTGTHVPPPQHPGAR